MEINKIFFILLKINKMFSTLLKINKLFLDMSKKIKMFCPPKKVFSTELIPYFLACRIHIDYLIVYGRAEA